MERAPDQPAQCGWRTLCIAVGGGGGAAATVAAAVVAAAGSPDACECSLLLLHIV